MNRIYYCRHRNFDKMLVEAGQSTNNFDLALKQATDMISDGHIPYAIQVTLYEDGIPTVLNLRKGSIDIWSEWLDENYPNWIEK